MICNGLTCNAGQSRHLGNLHILCFISISYNRLLCMCAASCRKTLEPFFNPSVFFSASKSSRIDMKDSVIFSNFYKKDDKVTNRHNMSIEHSRQE